MSDAAVLGLNGSGRNASLTLHINIKRACQFLLMSIVDHGPQPRYS